MKTNLRVLAILPFLLWACAQSPTPAETAGGQDIDAAVVPSTCSESLWTSPFDSAIAAVGYCFIGTAPRPGEFVATVPQPADVGCKCPFVAGDAKAALTVAIDFADVTVAGADWAGIHFGPQGAAHVPFGVSVSGFEGHGVAKSNFQLRARLCGEGKLIGKRDGTIGLHFDPASGTFRSQTADFLGAAVLIAANPTSAASYCGHWVRLQVSLTDKASGKSGWTQRAVRLYRADNGAFVP